MYKNIILITSLILSLISNTYSQSGTFDFGLSASPDGHSMTQTVSGVTLYVYSDHSTVPFPSIVKANWGSFPPFDASVLSMNGESRPSCTFEFSQPVNITTFLIADFDGATNFDLLFTPNTGTPYHTVIDGYNGSYVTLNFIQITSFVITNNAGGNICLGMDNLVMDESLPVELTSFTAKVNENKVILNWSTATEVNNYGFEIERSLVTGHQSLVNEENPNSEISNPKWEVVGFIEGSGISNSPKQYSFIDENPPAGNLQYRLKQIDTDGSFQYYSTIAEVNYSITGVEEKQLPAEFGLSQNYPNPFNPSTVISFTIGTSQLSVFSHTTLKVYDILGNEVAELVNEEKAPGYYNVKFDGSNLASGVYIYKLTSGNYISTKKLILMK